MSPRILLRSLVIMFALAFVSLSWADDPRSADMSETVLSPPAKKFVFELILPVKQGSLENIEKLMSPYQVVHVRERKIGNLAMYRVLISCPANTMDPKARILREDLPRDHPERRKVQDIIVFKLEQLPENTDLGKGKKIK